MLLIPLTNSPKYALVSDEDYIRLERLNWCLTAKGYVQATNDCKHPFMHGLVLGKPPKSHVTDHIDRNKLNNCRENLRHVHQSINVIRSAKAKRESSSRFKGVSLTRSKKKLWYAQIYVRGEHVSLGLYKLEEEAAKAYNDAALKYFGEDAYLNEL